MTLRFPWLDASWKGVMMWFPGWPSHSFSTGRDQRQSNSGARIALQGENFPEFQGRVTSGFLYFYLSFESWMLKTKTSRGSSNYGWAIQWHTEVGSPVTERGALSSLLRRMEWNLCGKLVGTHLKGNLKRQLVKGTGLLAKIKKQIWLS